MRNGLRQILQHKLAALIVGAVLPLSGCLKDASQAARVSGHLSAESAATTNGPQIPDAPTVTTINPGTVIDTSNEGGADSVSAHETSSGSLDVSKVSVGGSYQRNKAVSASFKVTGGIYAR